MKLINLALFALVISTPVFAGTDTEGTHTYTLSESGNSLVDTKEVATKRALKELVEEKKQIVANVDLYAAKLAAINALIAKAVELGATLPE